MRVWRYRGTYGPASGRIVRPTTRVSWSAPTRQVNRPSPGAGRGLRSGRPGTAHSLQAARESAVAHPGLGEYLHERSVEAAACIGAACSSWCRTTRPARSGPPPAGARGRHRGLGRRAWRTAHARRPERRVVRRHRGVGPRVRCGAADSRDAHLTLQTQNSTAKRSEAPADLRFLRWSGIAHVPDDPPRGVRGDPGACRKGPVICGFLIGATCSDVFTHHHHVRAEDALAAVPVWLLTWHFSGSDG